MSSANIRASAILLGMVTIGVVMACLGGGWVRNGGLILLVMIMLSMAMTFLPTRHILALLAISTTALLGYIAVVAIG